MISMFKSLIYVDLMMNIHLEYVCWGKDVHIGFVVNVYIHTPKSPNEFGFNAISLWYYIDVISFNFSRLKSWIIWWCLYALNIYVMLDWFDFMIIYALFIDLTPITYFVMYSFCLYIHILLGSCLHFGLFFVIVLRS